MGKLWSMTPEFGYYKYWICPVCFKVYHFNRARTTGIFCDCAAIDKHNKEHARLLSCNYLKVSGLVDISSVCQKCTHKYICFIEYERTTKEVSEFYRENSKNVILKIRKGFKTPIKIPKGITVG
jgi:hypothetical protein